MKTYLSQHKMRKNGAYTAKKLEDLNGSTINTRAYAFDEFLQNKIKYWDFINQTFYEFLDKEDPSFEKYHVKYLHLIATSIKEKPQFDKNDGDYLVALWAEFSISQATKHADMEIQHYSPNTFSWKDFEYLPHISQTDKRRHSASTSEQYIVRKRKRNPETPSNPSSAAPSPRSSHPSTHPEPVVKVIRIRQEDGIVTVFQNTADSQDTAANTKLSGDQQLVCESLLALHGQTCTIKTSEGAQKQESEQLLEDQIIDTKGPEDEAYREVENNPSTENQQIEPTEKPHSANRVEPEVLPAIQSPIIESSLTCDANMRQVSNTTDLAATAIEFSQQGTSQQEAEYSPGLPFTLQPQQKGREIAPSVRELSRLAVQVHTKACQLNKHSGENPRLLKESEKSALINDLLAAVIELNSMPVQKD